MRYCLKFIPKRGGEPLAKAANKRRKTKTNHLDDTAALGGGLLCPAGGGLVLLNVISMVEASEREVNKREKETES